MSNAYIRLGRLLGFCCLLLSTGAMAATECENNFSGSGDPRNAVTYSTFVTFPDLDVRSAMGQIQKIALDNHLEIGAQTFEGDQGKLTLLQKDVRGQKGFALMAAASKSSGRVALIAQVSGGLASSGDTLRRNMCDMLGKVRMDSAGAAIAEQTQQSAGGITDITATDLAKDVWQSLNATKNPELVAVKYTNRVYRVDGQVSGAMVGGFGGVDPSQPISMPFIVVAHASGIGTVDLGMSQITIMCHTAPDQFSRFARLHHKDYATVIGKVTSFDGTSLHLDCRYEK
jgi:hypothetical protein